MSDFDIEEFAKKYGGTAVAEPEFDIEAFAKKYGSEPAADDFDIETFAKKYGGEQAVAPEVFGPPAPAPELDPKTRLLKLTPAQRKMAMSEYLADPKNAALADLNKTPADLVAMDAAVGGVLPGIAAQAGVSQGSINLAPIGRSLMGLAAMAGGPTTMPGNLQNVPVGAKILNDPATDAPIIVPPMPQGDTFAAGLARSALGTASGFTTPSNALLAVAGGVGGTAVRGTIAGGFTAHMAKEIGPTAARAGEASVTGTPGEKGQAYGDLAVATGLTAMLGTSGATGMTRTPIEAAERFANTERITSDMAARSQEAASQAAEFAKSVPGPEPIITDPQLGERVITPSARDQVNREAAARGEPGFSNPLPQAKPEVAIEPGPLLDSEGKPLSPTPAVESSGDVTQPPVGETPVVDTKFKGRPIVEVPVSKLKLSQDVPQFKGGADERGIVEPLGGTFDRTGVAPIQLWERTNGDLEIISGRHRYDLAKRSGEETIPAQIHREADGFTAHQAAKLDAELNIRDGQGTVADYANYFRNSKVTQEAANASGLLGRSKGQAGFSIARGASEDVFSLFQAGKLTDSQARAISEAAPNNPGAQAIGTRAALDGKSAEYVGNLIKAARLRAESGPTATTGDLFGFDDTAMREMDAQAKIAAAKQRELRDQIKAVEGAAKRPDAARKLGVDVKDPEGILKRVEELKAERDRWDNWPMHRDLVAITRGEVAPVFEAPTLRAGEKGTGDLFQEADAPFNLAGESAPDTVRIAAEKAAQEKAAAEAKAKQEAEQGDMFATKREAPLFTPDEPFAQQVIKAAKQTPEDGWVNPQKVFVNRAYEQWLKEGGDPSVTLDQFKSQLAEAAGRGEIGLARADMPRPEQMANRDASEIKSFDAHAIDLGEPIGPGKTPRPTAETPVGERRPPGAAKKEGFFEEAQGPETHKFGARETVDPTVEAEARQERLERGINYTPIPNKVTKAEARAIVAERGLEDSERTVIDTSEPMEGRVRVALGFELMRALNDKLKAAKATGDTATVQDMAARHADVAEFLDDFGMRQGQAVQAFATWATMSPEAIVLRFKKRIRKAREAIAGSVDDVVQRMTRNNKGPLWPQYVGDISKAMDSFMRKPIDPKARGPLEQVAADAKSLFTGKLPKKEGPQNRPRTVFERVREQISNEQKLSESWVEARQKLLDKIEDPVEKATMAGLIPKTLDAPFTPKDIASVMSEIGMFRPERLSKMWGIVKNGELNKVADVLMEDQPNMAPGRAKEIRDSIKGYAGRLVDEQKAVLAERASEQEAARAARTKAAPSGPPIWQAWKKQAAKSLLAKAEKGLDLGETNTPALQDFTTRLVKEVGRRLKVENGAKATPLEPTVLLREAINNADKYKEAWKAARDEAAKKYAANPQALDQLDKIFGPMLERPFSQETLGSAIKAQQKAMDVKLSDLAREHPAKGDATGEALASAIVDQMGLKPADAAKLASALRSEFAASLVKARSKVIAQLVKEGNPVAKNLAKGEVQKIVEASNAGALSDATIYDMISERMNLPKDKPEVAAELMRRANRIQELPEGKIRDLEVIKMMDYLHRERGISNGEALGAWWYGSVLFNHISRALDFVSTGVNAVADNSARALASGDPAQAWAMLQGMKRGYGKGIRESAAILKEGDVTGYGATPEMAERVRVLEALSDADGWRKYPAKMMKYSGRIMDALDMTHFQAMREGEQFRLAVERERETGGTMKEAWRDALKALRENDAVAADAARQQATSEGLNPNGTTYEKIQHQRRTDEILEQQRPEEDIEASRMRALDTTFRGEMKGLLGAAGEKINALGNEVKVFRYGVAPFVRTMINLTNKGIDWTPLAIGRAFDLSPVNKLEGGRFRRDLSPIEKRELRTKIIVGTTMMSAILTAAMQNGEKEGKNFDITGDMSSLSPSERAVQRAAGVEPYSIKIGGKWFKYNTGATGPLYFALSLIGRIRDEQRFHAAGLSEAPQVLFAALGSAAFAIKDTPAFSSMGMLANSVGRGGGSEKIGEQILRLPMRTASGVVPAEFKNWDSWLDSSIKKPDSFLGQLIKDIPLAREGIKNVRLNRFGEEIKYPKTIAARVMPREGDEVAKFLASKNLGISDGGAVRFKGKRLADHPGSIYADFLKFTGPKIKREIITQRSSLNAMSNENAQKEVDRIVEEATDAWRSKTYGLPNY